VDIGRLLRQARSRAGLSQRTLAHRAGISQPSLSRWESGAALPGLDGVDRVLAVCGLELQARLVTRHVDLHARFADLAATGVEDRLGGHHPLVGLVFLVLAGVPDEVVLTGALAAAALGIPVERLEGDLLLPDDDDALARVLLALRPCFPEIILDGERFGVELTVALLRRHPVCDWFARQVRFTTRVLASGQTRPATTSLTCFDGRLVVQAPEALAAGGALRPDVLAEWHVWRAGSGARVAAA